MNRIRKIGNWLWLNKERMVLAVMVCFLIFRVYQVVSPAPEGTNQPFPPPKRELPDDVATPGVPPPAPPVPRADDWSPLWKFSLFNYRQPRIGQDTSNDNATQDLDLHLLDIQEASPGKYMAQIKTPSTTKWYEEGRAFESYELLDIDPEAQTVTIYVEQQTRTFELRVEQ